jgi:hypothetical protein
MLYRVCNTARVVLALLMMLGGFNLLLSRLRPDWFPPQSPFIALLVSSGFIVIPKLLEFIGGALLLFTRRRALALALLLPVIANIALTHLFFDRAQWFVVPILSTLTALAWWPERSRFQGLVESSPDP